MLCEKREQSGCHFCGKSMGSSMEESRLGSPEIRGMLADVSQPALWREKALICSVCQCLRCD